MQILTILLALVALVGALVARLPLPIGALIALGVFAILGGLWIRTQNKNTWEQLQ